MIFTKEFCKTIHAVTAGEVSPTEQEIAALNEIITRGFVAFASLKLLGNTDLTILSVGDREQKCREALCSALTLANTINCYYIGKDTPRSES